ncbi:MAG: hypothetical protein IPF99_27305 [Deltaproteobacteria bacterium]|nr:hypothetical protein [Deltaproteobacteria bacterium]
MATREGRKTPTGSEIDDWFDLLDEESPEPGPKAPPPPTEISRKITPAVDPVDSWDWDMEAPSPSVPPPIKAEPEEEEFTDFGGPTPVAGPIGAVSVSSPPKPETIRRFQGTMIFGATPLPPPSSAPPAPASERPAAPPPPPLPVATPASPQARSDSARRCRASGRPRAIRWLRCRPSELDAAAAPPVPLHHPELTSADLDDLEFEDVSTSRHSVPRVERRSEQATQQRSTPVVPVTEVQRTQRTPVVEASIPPEAQRSPVPSRPSAQQQRSLTPPSTRREMIDRFELGDFTGALSLAETLLEIDRTDSEARRIAETSRTRLRAIYVGRLGALDQVPVMMIPHAELRWLALDHRAGFVLSLVDGTSSIEEIIDVSTMPQLEVLRTLYNLLSQNVISLRRPRY